MERKNMWEHYTEEQERELEELAVRYRKCLDQSKTERECVTLSIAMAAENGYQNIEDCIREGVTLKAGDKVGPFYNRIINKFAEAIQKIGKQCLIFKVPRQDQLGKIVERVLQFQVEAVIVTASAMTKMMAEVILENNVPVILFNRFIPGLDISTVYVDAVNGATTVAEYLYQKGHRNIGYAQYMKKTGEELEKKIGFYSKLRQYGTFPHRNKTAVDYQSGNERYSAAHVDSPSN